MPAAPVTEQQTRHDVEVTEPFRLDLTVSVLRRLNTNTVDIYTSNGQYIRVLDDVHGPVVVRVMQKNGSCLAVTIEGKTADHSKTLNIVRRMLGVNCQLTHFDRAAQDIPWLRPLADAMRGVKPPRYPSLWEACVNAIIFQQVSLVAASTIVQRIISRLEAPTKVDDFTIHAFPRMKSFMMARDDVLRDAGLSASKLATLRRVADAIQSGDLDENVLNSLPSPEAAKLLCRMKGIGPWTATVILLRGLGRLDVFPMNDSSVTHNLVAVAGSAPVDIAQILSKLGTQRGMLYYHLLLARLAARDNIGRASTATDKPFKDRLTELKKL